MNIDRLVTMANDIAAFFDADPDKQQAARDAAGHLRRFWDPRMRVSIIAHHKAGGDGLSVLANAAVAVLASEEAGNRQAS